MSVELLIMQPEELNYPATVEVWQYGWQRLVSESTGWTDTEDVLNWTVENDIDPCIVKVTANPPSDERPELTFHLDAYRARLMRAPPGPDGRPREVLLGWSPGQQIPVITPDLHAEDGPLGAHEVAPHFVEGHEVHDDSDQGDDPEDTEREVNFDEAAAEARAAIEVESANIYDDEDDDHGDGPELAGDWAGDWGGESE